MGKSPTSEPNDAHLRGLEADHLQEIEGNPLTAEERAMFAMFEREGWTTERQRAHILARIKASTAVDAAE
jgi:hypothetical protein